MRYFAVVGNPILHSKSPEIYNSWFKDDNIDAHYSRIAAENINDALYLFDELKLSGINVTAPFKNKAFLSCDEVDKIASNTQSVNTIIEIDEKKYGKNTDSIGVEFALENAKIQIKDKTVCVIGAGNAGKSALEYLSSKTNNIFLINRDNTNSREIAEKFSATYIPLSKVNLHILKFDIIVNTLSPKLLNLKFDTFKKSVVVVDAIYNNSKLKEICKLKNITYLSGYEWLLYQAIPAYKSFTGKNAIITSKLRRKIQTPKRFNCIYLTGFMASGKTIIGKELAKKLKMDFYDLDEEIEKFTQKSINQIFNDSGETEFRLIESKILKSISKKNNAIISLGGGVILSESNRKIINKNSLVIWTFTSLSKTLQRLTNTSNRPLFNNSNISNLQNLYEKRIPLYFSISDLIINSEQNFERVVNRLVDEISAIKPIKEKKFYKVICPTSKSYFQREVAISLLGSSPTKIIFNQVCDDSLTVIRLAYEIGNLVFSSTLIDYFINCDLSLYSQSNKRFINKILKLDRKNLQQKSIAQYYFIIVSSSNKPFPNSINCGESGLAFNLFSGICALQDTETTIKAEGTLQKRNINSLITAIKTTGKEVIIEKRSSINDNQYPPLKINGKVMHTHIDIGEIETSQPISALLLLLSKLNVNAKITYKQIKSFNYALMTAQTIRRHNKRIIHKDGFFQINAGNELQNSHKKYSPEGCWSSATFWLILSACTNYNIKINNINPESLQPDKAILDIIKLAGGDFLFSNGDYSISKRPEHSFDYDCTNCPDLIPNLIVFASFQYGISKIRGINRLINKESNRLKVILEEFSKFHLNMKVEGDTLSIHPSMVIPAEINYHNDHRIEMAATLFNLILGYKKYIGGKIKFAGGKNKFAGKSYQTFYNDLDNFLDFIK